MLGIVYITGFGISLSGYLTCLRLASSLEEAFTEWGNTESVSTLGSLLRFYERCTAYDDFPSVTSIDFLMTLSLPNGVPGPWDMVSHAALQGCALLYQLPEQAGPAPWRPAHGSCDVWRVSAMVPGTQSISQNKR